MEKSGKKLGVFICTAIVAGNMMGSGIALLPSSLAAIGSVTLFSWLLAIAGALSLAFVYAKLGTLNPQEGGPIAYAQEVSPILGFQTGVLYFHANWIGNLAIAVAGVTYLSVFIPELTHPIPAGVATIAIVWIFAIINSLGASWVGRLTSFGVFLLLIPVVLTATVGWFYFKPEIFIANWNISNRSDFHALISGVLLCLWSFIGLESATTDANLVKNPKRTIPIATMGGTGIAALVYIASCTAISGMFPSHTVASSGAPFALASANMFGHWSAGLVSFITAFACLTSLGSWMMLVAQAGARDAHSGMLPKIFGELNAKGLPIKGVWLTTSMMTLLMIIFMFFSGSAQAVFSDIISIAVLLTILPYFYSCLNLIHLVEMKRPHKMFVQLGACILASIFCFAALMGAKDIILASAVIVSLVAMIFYERKLR